MTSRSQDSGFIRKYTFGSTLFHDLQIVLKEAAKMPLNMYRTQTCPKRSQIGQHSVSKETQLFFVDFSWGPGSGSCMPPNSLVYTLLQKKGNFKNVAILLRLSVLLLYSCKHSDFALFMQAFGFHYIFTPQDCVLYSSSHYCCSSSILAIHVAITNGKYLTHSHFGLCGSCLIRLLGMGMLISNKVVARHSYWEHYFTVPHD